MATKLTQPTKIYPASGGKYSNADIAVADNGGFTVTIREKDKPSTSDGSSQYMPPKSHVFTTYKDMEAFLERTLTGKAEGAGEEATEED